MAKKPTNMHAGHRLRLKRRYLDEGLDSFSEHQVLELLLYYALPQGDTNELAHTLLEHYGSLPAVLHADYEDLQTMKGIGAHGALLLTMLPDLWRYYQLACRKPQTVFASHEEIGRYVAHLFIGADYEEFYLLCLDTRNKMTRIAKINEGTVDSVIIEPRKVVEAALRHKAKNVVLIHNHPGGSFKPTSTDIHLTGQLSKMLGGLGVGVVDHIVVAGGEYISFWEKGLMPRENEA